MRFEVAYGVFVLILAVTAAVFVRNRKSRNRLLILSVGMWLMLFTLNYPFEIDMGIHFVRNVFLSGVKTMQMFTLDGDFIEEAELFVLPGGFAQAYVLTMAVLYLAAPIVTAGYILQFVHGVRSWWRWTFSMRKETWIFSEASEKALLLAESALKARDESICAVFCGVKRNDFDRVQGIGAIPFSGAVETLNGSFFRKRPTSVFFMSDSDERNLEAALTLIERKGDMEPSAKKDSPVFLYIFTSRPEAELLLNAADKRGFLCRRIAENRSIVYSELEKINAALLDAGKLPASAGGREPRARIRFLLAGCGWIGFEMLKALIWMYGREDIDLTLTVIDMEDMESRFRRSCPGLAGAVQPLPEKGAQAEDRPVAIHFINNADISAYEIDERFAETDYVFVALGDDARNLEMAIYLRQAFRRFKRQAHPEIVAAAGDPLTGEQREVVKTFSLPEIRVAMSNPSNKRFELFDIAGQPYNIHPFAGNEGYYSIRTMLNYELEKRALSTHLAWQSQEALSDAVRSRDIRSHLEWRETVLTAPDASAFYGYDYSGASSRASALYRLCRGEAPESWQEEHYRWNQYMLTEGFQNLPGSRPADGKAGGIKDYIAKYHFDIVEQGELLAAEADKDKRIARDGRKES